MRKSKLSVFVAIITITLMGMFAGCSKSNDEAKTVEKTLPKNADRKGDLPQQSCDAIEFAIAMYILQTGRTTTFGNVTPPTLADAEIERLNALGPMNFSSSGGAVTGSLDGSKNTVGANGHMDFGLDGATMKCQIRIGEGSFGIENGKVVIGEGTRLTFDGSPFVRKDGAWVKSE